MSCIMSYNIHCATYCKNRRRGVKYYNMFVWRGRMGEKGGCFSLPLAYAASS